jgi:hypothetical protein
VVAEGPPCQAVFSGFLITIIIEGVTMQKFFRSGAGFVLVALLCIIAGLFSEHNTVFMSIGGFWLVLGIVVRAKYGKRPTIGSQP